MVAYFIIACEIAFWIFVAAGLSIRYMLGKKRLGLALLAATPIVDVLLLVATAVDLRRGATASMVHGIAAIYIGVSVAFGHQMIAWADRYFQYWFRGGENPRRNKLYGREHARSERIGWMRHLLAWSIGSTLLYITIWWIGDPSRTEVFSGLIRVWGVVLGIDLTISISYSFWPRKDPAKNIG